MTNLCRYFSVWRIGRLMLQCLMNVAIVILVTGSGMPTGFSAILLPQLQANDSSLPTDDDWASWIGELYQQLKIVPINILFCFEVMRYFWGFRHFEMRNFSQSRIYFISPWVATVRGDFHLPKVQKKYCIWKTFFLIFRSNSFE